MQKQLVREINNGSWRSMGRYKDIINPTNVYKIIKSTTIENGLKRALATGDFGIKNPKFGDNVVESLPILENWRFFLELVLEFEIDLY